MPKKLKTKSCVKKRFRVTRRGKVVSIKVSKRHLLVNKSKRQKRLGKKKQNIFSGDARKIRTLLPYA